MKTVDSPYYPPRASMLGRRLGFWFRLRRALQLERFAAPVEVRSWSRFVLWMFVPGTLGLARGQRLFGGGLLTLWLLLIAVYWFWIGSTLSSWSYVLTSSVHSISAAMTIAMCYGARPGRREMVRASIYGFLFVLSLYVLFPPPLSRFVVQPIQVRGQTVLINVAKPVKALQRGEWVGYRIRAEPGGIWLAPGVLIPDAIPFYRAPIEDMGFDKILAFAGETVRFHEDAFEVNGVLYRRVSDQMPTTGELTVRENACFIWPAGIRFAHAGEMEPQLLRSVALVSKARVIGAAYRRWFWRKQTFEPLVVVESSPPAIITP